MKRGKLRFLLFNTSLYFLGFLCFLGMLMMQRIEETLCLKLIKIGDFTYQTYLSKNQKRKMKEEGVIVSNQIKYHYTCEMEEAGFENADEVYYLMTFYLEESNEQQVLNGTIVISKNTIFSRLLALWKEE